MKVNQLTNWLLGALLTVVVTMGSMLWGGLQAQSKGVSARLEILEKFQIQSAVNDARQEAQINEVLRRLDNLGGN